MKLTVPVSPDRVRALNGDVELAYLISWLEHAPSNLAEYSRDGRFWFRVTVNDIAERSGAPVRKVRSTLERGIKSGAIVAEKHRLDGDRDQTKSYRVADFI